MVVLELHHQLLARKSFTVLAVAVVFTPPLVLSELMVCYEVYNSHREQITALVLVQVCIKDQVL
jgi:phage terminase large subunit-like protein